MDALTLMQADLLRDMLKQHGLRNVIDGVITQVDRMVDEGEKVKDEHGEAMDICDVMSALNNLRGDLY